MYRIIKSKIYCGKAEFLPVVTHVLTFVYILQVIDKLEKYYEDFRRHDLYNKMVRDLDLDNVSSLSEDSCEGVYLLILISTTIICPTLWEVSYLVHQGSHSRNGLPWVLH